MTTSIASSSSGGKRAFVILAETICDRLAQAALALIVLDVLAGIILGVVAVAAWPRFQVLGSGPGGGNGIPVLALLAATGMGFPSMLLAVFHLVRGEWRKAGRALVLIGPAFLFFGFFFISHAFDPCGFGFADFRTKLLGSPLCQAWGGGLELHTRYHLLHHALVPTAFLVGSYWWALGKWHPAAERFAWWGNRRGRAPIS